ATNRRHAPITFRLDAVDLVPIPIHTSIFVPYISDTIKRTSYLNRLLNSISTTKFIGFSKLGSKAKYKNVQDRLTKLYQTHKSSFDVIPTILPSLCALSTIYPNTINYTYSAA